MKLNPKDVIHIFALLHQNFETENGSFLLNYSKTFDTIDYGIVLPNLR